MHAPHRRPIIPPGLAIVIGILAVSTGSIFVRYAQAYAPSLVIAAWRLALATLVLAPIALLRHRPALLALSKRESLLAGLSGFFLALHFATWITSLEYTSVASSVVLVSTAPLWVALLSPITIHEPLTRAILIGMSLAMIGVLIVAVSDACSWSAQGWPALAQPVYSREAFLGNLLALTGALMAAGYLLIGRRLRTGLSLVPYVFLVYGGPLSS
jgi:drug/metabolite transporter (DMT)-like permease